MDRKTAHQLAALIVTLSVASTLSHVRTSPLGSANPKSRFATIEGLVERGTFAIEQSPYKGTMDRVKKDGHLYSSKPPVLSTLAAAVYFLENRVLGWTLDAHEARVVASTIVCAVVLPHAVMLWLFWLFSLRLCPDDKRALIALLLVATTWLGVGYAVDLQNHTVAAALGLFALYAAHRTVEDQPESRLLPALSGLCAALLCTVDLSSTPLSVAVFLYVARAGGKASGKATLTFVGAALVPLALHFALTWMVLHSLLPAYLHHDLYERPLKEWTNTIGILTYTWNALLFGHHGLLIMTPAVALGGYGLVAHAWFKGRWRRLAQHVFWPVVVITVVYLSMNRNYGGQCVGFRWLIPASLWTMLFIAPALYTLGAGRRALWGLGLCLLLGRLAVEDALQHPWQHGTWDRVLTGAKGKYPDNDRASLRQKQR